MTARHDLRIVEEDVGFQAGPHRLSGTLTLPDGAGPFPGVLLLPGSGPVDRNESHKKLPLNVLGQASEFLTQQGFATLRYDKLGVGKSDGDFYTTGFHDNVAAAKAALEFLESDRRIRSDSVFLLGHSEGALTSTRLAADGADVAGVILLSGPAQSGESVLAWQALRIAEGLGGFQKFIIKLLRVNVAKSQRKKLEKIKQSTRDMIRIQLVAKINAKWMREFLAYDPAEDLRRIRVPVLAITGSKDIQVNPEDLKQMADLVVSDFDAHEVTDVTHILRREEGKPTISTYKKQAREPVDQRVFALIDEWLQKRVTALG